MWNLAHFKSSTNFTLHEYLIGAKHSIVHPNTEFITIVYIVRPSVANDRWRIKKVGIKERENVLEYFKNDGVLKMAVLLSHQNCSEPFIVSRMYRNDKWVVKIVTSREISLWK